RSVGSFFLNPVLDHARFAAVERVAEAAAGPGTRVPSFPAGDGLVKIPAAWLIEQAGFRKGYAGPGASGGGAPGARISCNPRRALVTRGGPAAASLRARAGGVGQGVWETSGVELASEPVLVGTGL